MERRSVDLLSRHGDDREPEERRTVLFAHRGVPRGRRSLRWAAHWAAGRAFRLRSSIGGEVRMLNPSRGLSSLVFPVVVGLLIAVCGGTPGTATDGKFN